MKSKTSILVLLSLLIMSCNQKNNNADITECPFEIIKAENNFFKKVGTKYQFTFTGATKNKSANIFDDVYTTLNVEFELDNGNILTREDYKSGLMTGFGDLEHAWKPNEIRQIDDNGGIDSDFIPEHYKQYPIKKVTAVIRFNTKDVMNGAEADYYYNMDITDIWKKL
ncbi:hypothetical protein [Flavobacterium soyangense]|uniref:Uncharacterized protein n=1 Tax=Flavobacterium soyangense TaxID=2023265 RepID=A0A930U8I2_9FLAO|nr:hypothetical protein [Flavobacterium soyangense]MBF2707435.1 hypothetical protein [Flavobacterium soyangense]